MKKSSWSRVSESVATLVSVAALLGASTDARALGLAEFCRGGRAIRPLRVTFEERIPRAASGVPLDRALDLQRAAIEDLRYEARRYFYLHRHDRFASLIEGHTFLLPEVVKRRYGIGTLLMGDISSAIRFREALWRDYVERFTTVKEASTPDSQGLRFEVSLDLGVFCRYQHPVRDLFSQ